MLEGLGKTTIVHEEDLTAHFRWANRFFRRQRPIEASCTHCDPFRQGGLLEISVPSLRCRHDAEGGCIMCNYGVGIMPQSQAELESQFDACLKAMGPELDLLLLCTNGSFLDEQSVALEIQESLLRTAQNSAAATIIIETHLDTLSPEKLRRIRQLIPSKAIILEAGLESADPWVQENCYLKSVPPDVLEQTIKAAKRLDMMFQLNVILGAPFLTAQDQAKDAERSIRWALDRGALAALFPMNIKPYTLLEYAHKKGLYAPISHWAVPLLLSRFSPDSLGRIDLAWYGNREIQYDTPGVSTIFPQDCPVCREPLQKFYRAYAQAEDGTQRYRLVQDVLQNSGHLCGCMGKAQRTEKGEERSSYMRRIQTALADALAEDKIILPIRDIDRHRD